MKRNVVFVLVVLLLLALIPNVFAQEGKSGLAATPEATAEATAEATIEATPEATAEAELSLTDIFASLPQSRTEDGGFVVGEPDAPITIVEFSDFACPHCQSYRPVIEQVIRQYVATGQAKFELRILPTAGGQLTYYVGLLTECATHQRQGAFWESYETLYGLATTGQYDSDIAQRLADALDLDATKLQTCVQTAKQTLKDMTLAQQVGVGGTPAVLVRYGDGEPEFITLDGRTYDQGGVAFAVLAQVIEAANTAE